MIIWNGWGFMVAVVVFASSLLAEIVVEALFRDDNYYQTAAWPLAFALAISAVVSWVWGTRLNRRAPGAEPAATPWLTAPHRLFFIPMQYWGPILLVAAAVVFIAR
jgi:hypothetical protein